ncbi:hypothetical protein B7R54_18915 [Subtercola boreus]|uniref:CopC domain-containing protein n=1 Tax=Subtercola boreus TaxID=120213 RepID=A0A3E0VAS4_9MICO|nr:copper resistance CopC family protein [Subtercola boreus]RFA06450.1 hypothetical protein B7R54_18915 [Subtercola boreus]TQL46896.1 hypothetical protein FB464_3891 [Subtercola boreus]
MNHPPARRRRVSILIACIAIIGSTLLTAQSASAHDALAESIPAAGETVTTKLDQVSLTFTEAPLSGFETTTIIRVTGADGVDVVSGEVSIADNILTASVSFEQPGDYLLQWQTVSVDGHPISGEYSFTYAVQPTTTSEPETSPAPAPAATIQVTVTPKPEGTEPAPSTSGSAAVGAGSAAADAGPGAAPIIALGVLGAGIVVAGAYFAVRRFRKTPPPA